MSEKELTKMKYCFSVKLRHMIDVKFDGKEKSFFQAYDLMFEDDITNTAKNWLRSETSLPRPDKMVNLLKLFDCDFDYLFGEQDTPRRCDMTITERLGLSEQAIELLKGYSDEHKRLLDALITTDTPPNIEDDKLLKYLLRTMLFYAYGEYNESYFSNPVLDYDSKGKTYIPYGKAETDIINKNLTADSFKTILDEVRKIYKAE